MNMAGANSKRLRPLLTTVIEFVPADVAARLHVSRRLKLREYDAQLRWCGSTDRTFDAIDDGVHAARLEDPLVDEAAPTRERLQKWPSGMHSAAHRAAPHHNFFVCMRRQQRVGRQILCERVGLPRAKL